MRKFLKYGKTITAILTAVITSGGLAFLSPELQARVLEWASFLQKLVEGAMNV